MPWKSPARFVSNDDNNNNKSLHRDRLGVSKERVYLYDQPVEDVYHIHSTFQQQQYRTQTTNFGVKSWDINRFLAWLLVILSLAVVVLAWNDYILPFTRSLLDCISWSISVSMAPIASILQRTTNTKEPTMAELCSSLPSEGDLRTSVCGRTRVLAMQQAVCEAMTVGRPDTLISEFKCGNDNDCVSRKAAWLSINVKHDDNLIVIQDSYKHWLITYGNMCTEYNSLTNTSSSLGNMTTTIDELNQRLEGAYNNITIASIVVPAIAIKLYGVGDWAPIFTAVMSLISLYGTEVIRTSFKITDVNHLLWICVIFSFVSARVAATLCFPRVLYLRETTETNYQPTYAAPTRPRTRRTPTKKEDVENDA